MYRPFLLRGIELDRAMRYLLPMRVAEHQWIWVGLWGASLLFAFAIGRSLPSGPPALELVADLPPDLASPTPAPVQVARRRALAPAASIRLPSNAAPSTIRPTLTLRSALNQKDPVQRTIAFGRALEQMDAEAIGEAMALLDELPPGADRKDERWLLLYRWGQLDGVAALEYATALEDHRMREASMQKALSGWATADPDAALVWAQDNFDGEDNPYLVPVISGVAQKDLYQATDLTYLLPYGRNRGSAVGYLVDGFMQQSPETSMDWARGLPDGVLKNGIAARVADRLARTDPAAYAYFPTTLTEFEASRRAVESYARVWGRHSPEEAAAWVDEQVPDELRDQAAAGVLQSWIGRDLEAATAWLTTQPPSEAMDGVISGGAMRLQRRNPEQAIDLALQISDEPKRNEVITRIAENWQRHDPEAAALYFNP